MVFLCFSRVKILHTVSLTTTDKPHRTLNEINVRNFSKFTFQNEEDVEDEEVEDKENKSESSSSASSSDDSSGSDSDWAGAESGWAHRLPEMLWTEPWAGGLSLLCTELFSPQEGAHPAVTHLRHLSHTLSFASLLFCSPLRFWF